MTEHIGAPVLIILVAIAVAMFLIAAAWPAPPEPYRPRLIAAGLFCWALSTFF